MRSSKKLVAGAAGVSLMASGLALVTASGASAAVDTKLTVPYSQDWSDAGLITADDDWSGVTGVQGYLGDYDSGSPTNVDPQTLTAETLGAPDVIANNTATSLGGVSNGGVLEAQGLGTVALQGSGSADAPNLVFRLDLTGRSGVSFGFDARDVDDQASDATQQLAVQYRVGTTGEFTNLPAGYLADASGTGTTTTTPVSVALPAEADGASDVFVRVLTTNAGGSDEWIGIDDVTVAEGTPALSVTDPAIPDLTVDEQMEPVQLMAAGGTGPYTWAVTAGTLPAGLTLSAEGELTGTPSAVGSSEVTFTATDDEGDTASADATITVTAAPTPTPIAEIQGTPETQGTDAASPMVGEDVLVEGVVTGVFADPYDDVAGMANYGGLDGFYVQTAGTGGATDATPDASDAIFVYTGNDLPAGLEIGDSVEVEGTVGERYGTTRLTEPTVTESETALAEVSGLEIAYPTTEAGREAQEGMLLAPTDSFTVTNSYSTNAYGEVGLATGDTPLLQPTDVARPGTPAYDEVVADNLARGVVLDDGTSINYLSNGTPQQDLPLPWLTADNVVRVGAEATLNEPVILNYDFDVWRFQPTTPVLDAGTGVATFEDTRAENEAPQEVGGDLKLATFNVLNYFNTTGEDFVANGGTCSYYTDRDGNPIANDTCTPNGPRGAADDENLARQQAKIVNAINAMDADVVSLEELENSVKLLTETDRDDAIAALVEALNADAGAGTWDYVASPATALTPANVAEQDVIRNGFIYRGASVEPVGESAMLFGSAAFSNAREPLAQVFKPVEGEDADAFAVVVNHFKSKGCSGASGANADAGDGQSCFNADRVGQAEALVDFVDGFKAERGVESVFLTGDFNSYTQEDPMQVLYEAGYGVVESDTEGDWSYSFSGLSGSLDHVLANDAAMGDVTGADVWEINANESTAYQYSRYNYNVTELYADDQFAASDHNPEVVGIDPGGAPVDVNLLNINDFHGRIDANTGAFATTIEQLRAEAGEENTLFLSAGDNIGASLFASSLQDDQPTIDVLNALELATSAVGNHEFDKGFEDLTGRVSDAADWDYLGANVYEEGTTNPALEEYALFEVGGVSVGVIGTVTEETPSLVSPAGVADLDFGDPVEATNRVAEQLSDGDESNGEADVIVAEFHEGAGAGTPDGATLEDEVAAGGVFASIVEDTSPLVDAIFTGHTHKQYAWDAPVPGTDGTRPVLQTGSYGENIGQIQMTVDPETGEVTAYEQRNVKRMAAADTSYPRVAEVVEITDAALEEAAEVGNQKITDITADITTAFSGGDYVDGEYVGPGPEVDTGRDDRSRESTMGGLVANALRDGVSDFADADLGVTNPGGLRAELLYAGDTADNPVNTDGVVTYAEANAVLPFSNTIAVVTLTGAELVEVLEQQWQPSGNSRPYLQLGLSDNVNVVADPTAAAGERITAVTIDGEPLDLEAEYDVSTFSFLATGGDNFTAFTEGDYLETGFLDADLWRNYLADNAPISPDFARQQVFATGLPTTVEAGEEVQAQLGVGETAAPVFPINAKSLDLTSLGSPENTEVEVYLTDGTETVTLDTFGVVDGIAEVAFTVPEDLAAGAWTLGATAQPTGTEVMVPVTVTNTEEPAEKVEPTVRAGVERMVYGKRGRVDVQVRADGVVPTGRVTLSYGRTELGRATLDRRGNASIQLPKGVLRPGLPYPLTVSYGGDDAVAAGTGVAVALVRPGPVRLGARVAPGRVVQGRTPARLVVTVRNPDGVKETGRVRVVVEGRRRSAAVRNGKAVVQLGRFGSPGRKRVVVQYGGSRLLESGTTRTSFRVVRRR